VCGFCSPLLAALAPALGSATRAAAAERLRQTTSGAFFCDNKQVERSW
jgi:hypothetical protein